MSTLRLLQYRRYALRLHDLDIHWYVAHGECRVEALSNT